VRCIRRAVALAVGALFLAIAPASGQTQPFAAADIRDTLGQSFASATFTQAQDQVLISITFRNRTALVGSHGIQIHTSGQCNPPTFETAGPIFNPTGKQHGLENSSGPMVGDLPNLVVAPAGVAVYNLSASLASLQALPTSLLGKSLVIFAGPDDATSQPEGNAGQRIACGVILARGAIPSSRDDTLVGRLVIAGIGGLLVAGGVLLRRRA
jgi:Cu-Zn family superoxide dismutase